MSKYREFVGFPTVRGEARFRLSRSKLPNMPVTILIADDNALVRAALRHVLENEKLGDILIEAENGKEALEKARETKPDLVILDLAMPLMDGFTTAREIGTLLPGVPVLMHTLYWSPRVQVEAMKAGVRKTVAKSDSNVLISAVRELLSELESSANPSAGVAPEPLIPELPSVPASDASEKSETGKNSSDEAPPDVQSRAS